MVIFTSNINILQYTPNAVVYNLSSYYSGFENITDLITKIQIFNTTSLPPNEFIYSPEFDNMYTNSIFSNNELFGEFIRIIINATEFNVIVLVAHDPYRDAITESIIKLIQLRYGYNCWEIEELEDLECLKESYFTPYGLLNLDADKKRFDLLALNGVVQKANNLINTEGR